MFTKWLKICNLGIKVICGNNNSKKLFFGWDNKNCLLFVCYELKVTTIFEVTCEVSFSKTDLLQFQYTCNCKSVFLWIWKSYITQQKLFEYCSSHIFKVENFIGNIKLGKMVKVTLGYVCFFGLLVSVNSFCAM